MDLAEYKKRNRKDIILPSGLPLQIRKLTAGAAIKFKYAAPAKDTEGNADEADRIQACNEMICEMVVGETKIVEKPVDECGVNELSVDDIENEDWSFIVAQICKFSGLEETPESKKSDPEV